MGRFNHNNFSFKKLNFRFIELIDSQIIYKKLFNSMLKFNFCLGRLRVKKEINKISKIFL